MLNTHLQLFVFVVFVLMIENKDMNKYFIILNTHLPKMITNCSTHLNSEEQLVYFNPTSITDKRFKYITHTY